MSESFDYLKFVPGFDFLKQMAQPGQNAPTAHQWVAPTMDPEEIEKRIQELKTVQFWLEQNSKAVSATVQALEVQLMTLKTLKGMNMSMSDLMKGMEIKPSSTQASAESQSDKAPAGDSSGKRANPFAASFAQQSARENVKEQHQSEPSDAPAASKNASPGSEAGAQFLKDAQKNWLSMQEQAVAMWQEASKREYSANAQNTHSEPHSEPEEAAPEQAESQDHSSPQSNTQSSSPSGRNQPTGESQGLAPDPMKWWGALTEQFSDIATKALNEIQKHNTNAANVANETNESQAASPTQPPSTQRSDTKSHLKSTAKTASKPSAQPPKQSPKTKAKKSAPKVAPPSKAAVKVATSRATPAKKRDPKRTLSSVLAKTIADSDANPIQNTARKKAR